MENILQVIVFLKLIKLIKLLCIYIYIKWDCQNQVYILLLNHFPFQVIVKYHVIVHVVLKYLAMKIIIAYVILIHTKMLIAMVKNR